MTDARSPFFADMPSSPLRIDQLLWAWHSLILSVDPYSESNNPREIDDRLAAKAHVSARNVARVRWIRNQCSHPARRGWPSQAEVDWAIGQLEEIWSKLSEADISSSDYIFGDLLEKEEVMASDNTSEPTARGLAKEYGMRVDEVFDWFEIQMKVTIIDSRLVLSREKLDQFHDYHRIPQ